MKRNQLIRLIEKENRHESGESRTICILKLLRLLIHVLLALTVLASAITSKISFLLITNELDYFEKNESNEKWLWTLLLTLCTPYAISFMLCLVKIMFRQVPNPSLVEFFTALVFETISAIGTSILCFGVFSKLDLVRSILLVNLLSIVPSVVNVLVGSESPRTKNNLYFIIKTFFFKLTGMRKKDQILMFNMNLMAALMQISGILILIFSDFLDYSKWKTILAIFLVSVSLLFNYFSFGSTNQSRFKLKNVLIDHLKRSKHNIDLTRQKIGLFTNPWKIGVIFLSCYIFYPQKNLTFWLFDQEVLEKGPIVYVYPLLVQVVSSMVCFLASSLAYKLRMNRFSFALPMTLVTPLSIVASVLVCEFRKPNLMANNWMDVFSSHFICTSRVLSYKWQLVCGLCLWWLSNLWSSSHIWSTDGTYKFKNVKRIFKFQNFNTVFAENSLMFNYPPKNQDQAALEDSESEQDVYTGKTTLFICATMWHENENEMLQLLKSIMRLDIDQSEKRRLNSSKSDCFDYEAHIFFDDAISHFPNGSSEPNHFVQNLIKSVEEAALFAHKYDVQIEPPTKIVTPYGGQLRFKLPGGNFLIIHLKDKTLIRNKKRWSQIMYMYYLLGYKYFGDLENMEKFYHSGNVYDVEHDKKKKFFGFGNFLKNIDNSLRQKLENTFILTLDGDVEFRPNSVKLMIDKMRESKKIGSVCGRVHPIGSGPIVWYQIFEYAVGHWLQKVSEHIFGTVMCSPGCFSLLRGEDRWLSTLIIQQGYYVAYCSAATSYTYSPETFNEYYNQRRRWIPSTMANLIDFLLDYKHILKVNQRVTYLFVCYILVNFFASILGPATITLMIADTLNASLELNLWLAYFLAVLPTFIFIVACFSLKNDAQIKVAAFLSTIFVYLMIVIMVGAAARTLNSPILSPSSVILFALFFTFTLAAIIHPKEFKCIVPGVLYFITLPSAFVLLNIYAVINLNNVSWGTREIKGPNSVGNNSGIMGLVKKLIVKYTTSKSEHSNENMVVQSDGAENVKAESTEIKNWTEHASLKNSEFDVMS
ncbi:chitin synthase, partial [Brachionus plicatilis]